MQDSYLTQIILPLVLAFILYGMGLSLAVKDFARVLKMPKPVFVGLAGQIILLPLLAFAIALVFDTPAHIAIGIMMLAACPGGTTSNLISHIAKANLALSVTLTAIATIICVITTPLIIVSAISYFSGESVQKFSILDTSLSLIIILVIPIALGMITRFKAPNFAHTAQPYFKHLAVIFMLTLIVAISYTEREVLISAFPDVFIIMFCLNVFATLMGVMLARVSSLSHQDALTLGIEVGTQNSTIAMLIAISIMQQPDYALAAAVYGVFMYIGAAVLVLYSKRRQIV